MKKIFQISLPFLLLAILTISTSALKASSDHPDPMLFSLVIPDAWKTSIVRQDFENQTIISLKNGNQPPAFLFSISRVTEKQWLALHHQLANAAVTENRNGYVIYVEKTTQQKIKGTAAAQYQQILSQLDIIIQSIRINA